METEMKKVVVIGANAAGMSAASRVKRQKPHWKVLVFEKGSYISYGACGIPYYVQGLVPELNNLVTVTPQAAVEERGLDLHVNCEVTKIDPKGKSVTVNTPGGTIRESFDFLVIATGAVSYTGGLEYTPSRRIFTVNSLSDGEAIRNLMDKGIIKRCAVIGGGYIAIEMLEAFKERGLETHLVHRRAELARTFENEISGLILHEMEKEGIVLKLNRGVTGLWEKNGRVTVHSENEDLEYDLVVVATGIVPNSKLARDCGITLGVRESIRVNIYMQTNYHYIYAAGDCTETKNLVNGKPAYVALALKANKEGVIAGTNICGGRDTYPGVLGTAITKFCNLGIARTGLTLDEALKSGYEAVKIKVDAKSKAHYYPGSLPLTVVIIADKKDGRLLGAQLAGPVESVKRIDVYATAISARLTAEDLFHLDLSYAPPFSPVYDPVVLSGRVSRRQ